MPIVTCSILGITAEVKKKKGGEAKLPRGWKKTPDGKYVSDKALKKKYIMRAATVPVAMVVLGYDAFKVLSKGGNSKGFWGKDDCAEGRAKLNDACKVCCNLTMQACNYVCGRYAAADIAAGLFSSTTRTDMPAFENSQLYHDTSAMFPQLPSASIASLCHKGQRKYSKEREQYREAKIAVPQFRSPQAFPLPGGNSPAFKVCYDKTGHYYIRFSVRETEFTAKLRNGREFKRQMAIIYQLVRGNGIMCDARVFYDEKPCERSGAKKAPIVMVTLCGWIPKKPSVERNGTMDLATHKYAFLTAQMPDKSKWNYNGDEIKSVISAKMALETRDAREAYLQRSAEDLKREKRWPADKRRRFSAGRQKKLETYEARLSEFCHVAVKLVVQYANRHKVAVINFDCTHKAYFGVKFPWRRLQDAMIEKCDDEGIAIQILGRVGEDKDNTA